MLEKLSEIDCLLAKLTVNGDNLMIVAVARQELKDLYDSVKEDDNERS